MRLVSLPTMGIVGSQAIDGVLWLNLMTPVRPIFLTELFPDINSRLVELLRGLSAADWRRPTACSGWAVRDIAAHLLDGNLQRLSLGRDALSPLEPSKRIRGYGDLIDFLNELNAQWVTAARRLSPRVLVELLELTGRQMYEHFRSLDPFGDAMFPVAWAGETISPNWFDIAREFTEKWHHQQQIRDAVEAPPLTDREHLFPVLDTFLRGLPNAYRAVDASDGTTIAIRVQGVAGGDWALVTENGSWILYEGPRPHSTASIVVDQNDAWRLFTKGLTSEEARARAAVEGDLKLVEPAFAMVSVIG